LAFTKEQKQKMVAEYCELLQKSQAVFIIEHGKMNMKEIDTFRAKVRDAGGVAHICKNTLFTIALKEQGYEVKSKLAGTSLVGFALQDAPALAKAFDEITAKSEIFALKKGFLDNKEISAQQIKALADLPPLPVMRATLLGTIMAPASQLVRTLAEPARGLAAVIKAYSEKDSAPAAA